MAVYAIGDIQGCYDELQQLLERIQYDPSSDVLWFVGDLVNRGPSSLNSLRFVKSLGDKAITVLGNHDLHMLAVSEGFRKYHKGKDSFTDILDATDRDELIDWLRHRPLIHHDPSLGYTLIHAGLPPQWDLSTAQQCAQEVETILQGKHFHELLANMYADDPVCWDNRLSGWERLRFIINAFTRIRYCNHKGEMALKYKGAPGTQSCKYIPWFEIKKRRSRNMKIIFGHWSTLGLVDRANVFALDTGCVWGGKLTAMRLDVAPEYTQVHCPGARKPSLED